MSVVWGSTNTGLYIQHKVVLSHREYISATIADLCLFLSAKRCWTLCKWPLCKLCLLSHYSPHWYWLLLYVNWSFFARQWSFVSTHSFYFILWYSYSNLSLKILFIVLFRLFVIVFIGRYQNDVSFASYMHLILSELAVCSSEDSDYNLMLLRLCCPSKWVLKYKSFLHIVIILPLHFTQLY